MNAQEYNLNIRPGYGYSQTVKVSQDDIGRPLEFHLYDGMDMLAITTGTVITIHATKPSGLGFTETCTWSGSTASISTTESMTQESGAFPAELVITSGDDVLGTANFTFCVERSPHQTGTTDGVAEDLQDIYEQLDDLKNEISGLGGLSDDVKAALMAVVNHVGWENTSGQQYIDALEAALYPPATLVSISAVYTQSGTVYDNDTLDSLKADLVVTAHYDDSTTATVTAYTLSGTLTAGTSTITVSYGGKTTTFSVTVTHATQQYTITNTLTNCTNSNTAVVINENAEYTGVLTADADYVLGTVVVTMGGTDITGTAYNAGDGSITIQSVTGNIEIEATATAAPITIEATFPLTLTWNSGNTNRTLTKQLGAQGTQYRVEVDVTSISSSNAYIYVGATGAGGTKTEFAKFNGEGQIGTTGTITKTVTLNQHTAGAQVIQLSCNKGTETANQTAVISAIRIYEV